MQYGELKAVVKVVTEEVDGDEFGNEWQLHYVLYETITDPYLDQGRSQTIYELYEDDGKGNGVMVASGNSLTRMRHMTLRLGDEILINQKESTNA